MSTDTASWKNIRITHNLTAAATAAILLPVTLHALHIAGDQYGVGLALLIVAAGLDKHADQWITRTLLYAIALGDIADHHVLTQALAYLTGATP